MFRVEKAVLCSVVLAILAVVSVGSADVVYYNVFETDPLNDSWTLVNGGPTTLTPNFQHYYWQEDEYRSVLLMSQYSSTSGTTRGIQRTIDLPTGMENLKVDLLFTVNTNKATDMNCIIDLGGGKTVEFIHQPWASCMLLLQPGAVRPEPDFVFSAYVYYHCVVEIGATDTIFSVVDEDGNVLSSRTLSGVTMSDVGSSFVLTLQNTTQPGGTTAQTFIDSVKVSTGADSTIPEAPIFSPAGKYISGPTQIDITCPTEGTTIYYTTDGTTPTTSSTLYAGPVTVDDGTVLKAIAVGGDVSSVTGRTYVVPQASAQLIYYTLFETDPLNDSWTLVNGGPTTLAPNYQHYYWQEDEYRSVLLMSQYSTTSGTTRGIQRTITLPAGMENLKVDLLFTVNTNSATDMDCIIDLGGGKTVEFIHQPWASCMLLLQPGAVRPEPDFSFSAYVYYHCIVEIGETDTIFSVVDEDGNVLSWQTLSGVTIADVGPLFVLTLQNTTQPGGTTAQTFIDSVKVSTGAATAPEAPVFSPAGKYISGPTQIEISCPTAGTTIYYTTDGITPTTSSTLYAGPVTVDGGTVLKAIAVGEDISSVSSRTYVVPDAYDNPVDIPYGSVTVDGDLADWDGVMWTPLDQFYNPLDDPQAANDVADAAYAVKWVADKVYVAVKVQDTAQKLTDDFVDWFAQDGVEIYLHTTGMGSIVYPDCEVAQQYTIGIKPNGTDVWAVLGNGEMYPDKISIPLGADYCVAKGHKDGEWLYYEVALTPYEFLGVVNGEPSIVSPLAANYVIGVDVCVVANDGSTAPVETPGYTGMKSSNLKTYKSGNWENIGLHKLIAAARIPGDANEDGMVDVGDLGILAANYGTVSGATWELGDFNEDGAVDVGDLGILAANYGAGSSSANWDADYAKVFGTAATLDDTEESSTLCSMLGLPLIAGLVLIGFMMVKLED